MTETQYGFGAALLDAFIGREPFPGAETPVSTRSWWSNFWTALSGHADLDGDAARPPRELSREAASEQGASGSDREDPEFAFEEPESAVDRVVREVTESYSDSLRDRTRPYSSAPIRSADWETPLINAIQRLNELQVKAARQWLGPAGRDELPANSKRRDLLDDGFAREARSRFRMLSQEHRRHVGVGSVSSGTGEANDRLEEIQVEAMYWIDLLTLQYRALLAEINREGEWDEPER